MRFEVLGPLRVTGTASPVRVPRGRAAAALCWLLVNANRDVSVESLVPVLWSRPPAGAATKARVIARSLSAALEPGTVEVGPRLRLVVADDAIDANRFERLLTDAARHRADGDPARAQANLHGALALWRGEPYPELGRALPALAAIDRLSALRLEALEALNALVLTEPVDYTVVADLRAELVRHPERVALHRQLATALYRTGRQVEALEILRGLRERFGDTDGRTAALQAAILRQEPIETGC